MLKQNSLDKIIVIVPHPDDETLGCGGTLLRHKAEGYAVACVFVTSIQEKYGFASSVVEKRKKEIEKVCSMYSFDAVYHLNYPTTLLTPSDCNGLIGKFSQIFFEFKPNTVYLPFYGDVHSDHRIIFNAAFSCTKVFRYPFIKNIFMYETVSETDFSKEVFLPHYYVNIASYMEKKKEILKIYESELGDAPFPRSLDNVSALATFRGGQSGFLYAEAFQVLRSRW